MTTAPEAAAAATPWSTELRSGSSKAGEALVVTEKGHRLPQREARSPTRQRDPHGRLGHHPGIERLGERIADPENDLLDAPSVGEVVTLEGGDHVVEHEIGSPALHHGLRPRLLIELSRAHEQPGQPAGGLVQLRNALLDLGGEGLDHRRVKGIHRPRRIVAGEPGFGGGRELGRAKGFDVLGVDMTKFLQVKHGRRLVDRLKREQLNNFSHRTNLNLVGRTPAQQSEGIRHGIGQIPLVAEGGQRHRIPPLRQLLPLLVHEQRQVGIHRLLAVTERIPQQHDLRRRVEEILTADDMGDAHVVVVDSVGDKEDWAAVATTDHEILDRLMGDLDSTPNDVVNDGDAIVGSPEAHDDAGPILDVAISRPAVIAAL